MTIRRQRAQLALKLESTVGTENPPVASDVFLVFNPDFTPEIGMNDRKPVASHFSPFPGVPGLRSGKMSFEVELVGRSALSSLIGSDVAWGAAMKASGYAMTSNASSVVYTPTSNSSTASLALFMDGKCYRLWGAMGNVKFTFNDGEPAKAMFEFTGSDFAVVDSALLSSTVLEETLPPAFMGATMVISNATSSLAICTESCEVDTGNVVALRKCASATSGHRSALITDRRTAITIDPEAVTAASLNFFADWRAGTEVNFAASFGSTAGNRFAIAAGKVQYQSISLADREGLLTYSINALCNKVSNGDDEFTLTIY